MAERDTEQEDMSKPFEGEDSVDSDRFTNPIAFEDEDDARSPSPAKPARRPSIVPTVDLFDKDSTPNTAPERLLSEDNTSYLPESLENITAGSAQVKAWKERLVQHIIQGKENVRDKRRREAAEILESGSMIDPNGEFRKRWDMVQIVLLIYVAFSVPYRMGFNDPVLVWSGWFWFDLVVDLYFVSDLVVSFRTAYYNSSGELVVDAQQIRQNYVKTWFVVDISSCFPGNYISCVPRPRARAFSNAVVSAASDRVSCCRYAVEEEGNRSSRMIKLLRMLRLLKLLRLARLNRLIRRYEEEFASLMTTFKLAKLVVLIIVVGHWYVPHSRQRAWT